MTTELFYLTLVGILLATLWMPYIIGVNTVPQGTMPAGAPDGFVQPPNWRLHRPWVQRAYRAHQNLVEQAVPFAIVVLVAHLAGVFNGVTVTATAIFFWLRLAHAVGYITGWAGFPLRPLIFLGGWLCILAIGVAILAA